MTEFFAIFFIFLNFGHFQGETRGQNLTESAYFGYIPFSQKFGSFKEFKNSNFASVNTTSGKNFIKVGQYLVE